MDITARIYPVENAGNLLANASICIEEQLVIKGFRVLEGKKGHWVAFPSVKGADDKYYDQAYCLDEDSYEEVCTVVLEAYGEAITEKKGSKKSKRR